VRWKTLILLCGKYIQNYMYKSLSESARFCRRHDKNISVCFFWFTVLTAVHLQNANGKFHEVVQRRYSGEVQNVYTSVGQICSGQHIPNIVRIGPVLWKIWQKTFWCVFSVHTHSYREVTDITAPCLLKARKRITFGAALTVRQCVRNFGQLVLSTVAHFLSNNGPRTGPLLQLFG